MAIVYSQLNDRGRFAGKVEYEFASPQRRSKILGGKVAQVSTITVDSSSNSASYAVTLNSIPVSVTSDSSGTVAEVAELFKDAINQDSRFGGKIVATRSAGVVTLTAKNKGESFTLADSDAKLTTATGTSAATGDTLPFGCAALLDASNTGECLLPDTSNAVNKVVTWTPSVANSTIYTANITILSGTYEGQTFTRSYTSDGTATAKEIVDSITATLNAALPSNTVLVSDNDAVNTFTSEIDGLDFVVAINNGTIAVSTAQGAPFLGAAERYHKEPANDDGDAQYDAGDVVSIIDRGFVWVLFEGSDPTIGSDDVYIRVTASASEQAGTFRASQDSTDCYPLPPGRAIWRSVSETGVDGNTICLLELK